MGTASASAALENRLAELLMSVLAPCDLGDGIEVVHDVEVVEIEMECALDDPPEAAGAEPDAADTLPEHPVFDELMLLATTQFIREDIGTQQFVRESAPYERIELQVDPGAFRRAVIEDARRA
jgi:hypothetical protein